MHIFTETIDTHPITLSYVLRNASSRTRTKEKKRENNGQRRLCPDYSRPKDPQQNLRLHFPSDNPSTFQNESDLR
jgi:hypothetical protein